MFRDSKVRSALTAIFALKTGIQIKKFLVAFVLLLLFGFIVRQWRSAAEDIANGSYLNILLIVLCILIAMLAIAGLYKLRTAEMIGQALVTGVKDFRILAHAKAIRSRAAHS